MSSVLDKLLWKGQEPVLLLEAPAEFTRTAADLGEVDTSAKGRYTFVLAFAKSLAEADKIAKTVGKALADDGIFWMAYPKGTSKRYRSVDINRDTGHARMAERGFDGVAMIAIDDDWSAMRYKRQS